jgi:hypothetical protein
MVERDLTGVHPRALIAFSEEGRTQVGVRILLKQISCLIVF